MPRLQAHQPDAETRAHDHMIVALAATRSLSDDVQRRLADSSRINAERAQRLGSKYVSPGNAHLFDFEVGRPVKIKAHIHAAQKLMDAAVECAYEAGLRDGKGPLA